MRGWSTGLEECSGSWLAASSSPGSSSTSSSPRASTPPARSSGSPPSSPTLSCSSCLDAPSHCQVFEQTKSQARSNLSDKFSGAFDGLWYYVHVDWSKLMDGETWIDGATQIFFAYSVGMGALPALGSYNKFHHDCFRFYQAVLYFLSPIFLASFLFPHTKQLFPGN